MSLLANHCNHDFFLYVTSSYNLSFCWGVWNFNVYYNLCISLTHTGIDAGIRWYSNGEPNSHSNNSILEASFAVPG